MVIEKTEWSSVLVVFLGILLDGAHLTLSIPLEKQEKVLRLLNSIKDQKKATIKQLQTLTGYLNFLFRAFFAGRTFTRRMYSKCVSMEKGKNGKKLKGHHHMLLDSEFKFDCNVWRLFLKHFRDSVVCRPMIDIKNTSTTFTVQQLNFASDASKNTRLGMGMIFNNQ